LKLTITGRHTAVGKEVTQYIRKRFSKWSQFLPPDMEVHVTVTVEGYRHQVEVSAHSGRYTLNGRQTTKDVFSAVDLLAEKMWRQISRQREKHQITKTGVLSPKKLEATVSERVPAEKRPPARILQVERYSGKPMTREEAVLQLQNSNQPFLVFQDDQSGQMNVLVRRKDGNFKLIIRE